jgi:16S rRNA (guanine966-N2)-methyltransferase
MRIVAGHFRSRTLQSVRGLELRPTSDRLRETLFNILGERVVGAVFLDIFAGTGAVGIEALSRGASRVVFIEKHAGTAELIRKNLFALGVRENARVTSSPDGDVAEVGSAEVIHGGANAALKKLAASGMRADLIFADPPYADKYLVEDVLEFVGENSILNAGGLFMAEHTSRVKLSERFGKLRQVRALVKGDSGISFYSE